jgi:hypothetical protein
LIAHIRLFSLYLFRRGDTVTATEWEETKGDAQRWLGQRKVWLNREGLGLGHDAV